MEESELPKARVACLHNRSLQQLGGGGSLRLRTHVCNCSWDVQKAEALHQLDALGFRGGCF